MDVKPAQTKTKIKEVENQQKQVVKNNFTTEKIENIEEKAFEFIKKFEGFSAKAYWDYRHCSIGYGTTTRNCGEVIDEKEAKKRAIQKIKDIRKHNNLYKYDDNLEIALISFIYNVGHKPSGLDRYLKNKNIKGLKNRFKEYINAGGKPLKGLEKRRQAEVDLF